MKIGLALRDFFFPPKCPGCYEIFKAQYGRDNEMCEACKRKWEVLRATVCADCGEPFTNCKCAPKALERAGVSSLIKLVPYRQKRAVSNNTVLYIKRHRDARVFAFLADQLAYEIERTVKRLGLRREDIALCYSPRRRGAVAETGFDQARLLSLGVSKRTQLPTIKALARVGKLSRAQKKLNAKGRSENVRGAFSLARGADVKNKTVFLIDDLVTTGSTMAECARQLKRGGAALVIGVCVAFTEKETKNGVDKENAIC